MQMNVTSSSHKAATTAMSLELVTAFRLTAWKALCRNWSV